MKSFISSLAVVAASAASLVAARPAALESRVVIAPRLTYPHSGTVWNAGEVHNITWNLADVPAGTTIRGQYISLRYNHSASYTPLILASNIDLHQGRIEVTVPTVFSAGYYSLLLFGNSASWGDEFTINGPISA